MASVIIEICSRYRMGPLKGMISREGSLQELYFAKGTRTSQGALPRWREALQVEGTARSEG